MIQKTKKKKIFLSFSNDHTWQENKTFPSFHVFLCDNIFVVQNCIFSIYLFSSLLKKKKNISSTNFSVCAFIEFFFFLYNWRSTSKERWCVAIIRWIVILFFYLKRYNRVKPPIFPLITGWDLKWFKSKYWCN